MPEPSARSFPHGIHPATFDLVLVHAAEALRGTFMRLTDEWELREKTGAAQATFDELCVTAAKAALASAVEVLNHLPYGVGICTPYEQFNRSSTFEPAVTIAINPIDGVERLRHILVTNDESREDVTATFAVRIGDEIVAASAIDMFSGLLSRVCMNDGRLVTSSDPDGLDCNDIIVRDDAERLATGMLLLYGEPADHDTLLRILGQEFHEQGVVGVCSDTVSSAASDLLDVAWGSIAAFALSGGDTVEAWQEWPLLAFARAAGIRLFRTTVAGGLRELPLRPETDNGKPVLCMYDQLFVASRYVGELAEHVAVQQLA
jgi:hypothetical protein